MDTARWSIDETFDVPCGDTSGDHPIVADVEWAARERHLHPVLKVGKGGGDDWIADMVPSAQARRVVGLEGRNIGIESDEPLSIVG